MQKKTPILVIGSVNTDMVCKTKTLPLPGQTVLGGTFFMNAGGKGGNQAVSVARTGGNCIFVCKTGNDMFGAESREAFKKDGMDTTYCYVDNEHPSGVALISVDEKGENCIVVASGANAYLTPQDIKNAEKAFDQCEIVLVQLETPMDTIECIAELCTAKKKKLVLNPAPAATLSDKLLNQLYMITPNETEAEFITGIKITNDFLAVEAAKKLNKMGVKNVVITLGKKGALLYENGKSQMIPAYKVNATDTTAAGDVFNGALCVALSEGKSFEEAIKFSCKASAISVTRSGAQASVPKRLEIDYFDAPIHTE